MSTQSVLEYASRKIGGVPRLPPVVGGSGRRYWTITAALAGESGQISVVTGVVPQAGTKAGVVVFQAGQSAVNDFYKDFYVLNTDTTPSDGLVSQYGRVSGYTGASRTATLDKPWDFSAESDVAIISPARIALEEDVTEDVTITIPLELDLQGHRIKGKIDVTAGRFLWIRGGTGYVTNGIQKTDFGLLKVDDCTVSRRDATIYAILLTEGSNRGRCELFNGQFGGRVAGRRGRSGWDIRDCKNLGIPNSTGDNDEPYALVESVAGVAIAFTQVDVILDTEFGGAILYSENSLTGATAYLSVIGVAKFTSEYRPDTNWLPKRFSIARAVSAGILNVTTATGAYNLRCDGIRGELASPSLNEAFCSFFSVKECSSTSQLILDAISIEASYTGFSFFRGFWSDGPANSSGTFILGGTAIKRINLAGSNARSVDVQGPFTGSITVSGGQWQFQGGGTVGYFEFGVPLSVGAPVITVSATNDVFACKSLAGLSDSSTSSVGIWTISGVSSIKETGVSALIGISQVAGGSIVWSGLVDIQAAASAGLGGISAFYIGFHQGTGGTVTFSGPVSVMGGHYAGITVAAALGAGATVLVSSATVRLSSMVSDLTASLIATASTATSVASVTGAVTFDHCTFIPNQSLLTSTPAGASVTGPASAIFEFCAFEGTLQERSGAGTYAWTAGAVLRFIYCNVADLFTFVGTSFTLVESIETYWNGNSGNKSISASGSRPTTYRHWGGGARALRDDLQPEVIAEWTVLAAAAALARGQPVTVNSSGQAALCVAGSIVEGISMDAPAGAGNPTVVVRKGRLYVTVNAGVVAGNNLALDLVTPTQADVAAFTPGQNCGWALEARGATVAGKSYSIVDVR